MNQKQPILQEFDIDEIIGKLLTGRAYNLFNHRFKQQNRFINLTESEIVFLCLKSKEILFNQPIFLELETPIKVCGIYHT